MKIDQKIVGYEVVKADQTSAESPAAAAAGPAASVPAKSAEIVQMHEMHEKVERPDMLIGSTYKIKTPVSEHAFYITINDMVLNPDTPHEKRQPFEIFINSKNMDHYQWITGLTLIISAVFRKGGDVTFLVKELQSVFDPKGGYFKKGGKFMPSLVAEIGVIIENHLKIIGLISAPGLDKHQKKLVDQKRKEYELWQTADAADDATVLANAGLCHKCHVKAMVMMDGCMTCLSCGESKCG